MIYNPIATKLYPWQVALARRTFVTWMTLPAIWSEAYLKAWWEVYRA